MGVMVPEHTGTQPTYPPAVPLTAFALVLASAVLHASWNLLIKSSRDPLVASWLQVTTGALVFLPVLIFGGLPVGRWWSVAASSAIHLGYSLTLVAAYERGDLSLMYPIARGIAPVLITLGAAVLLDDVPDALGLVAIGLIAVGILSLIRRPSRGVGWALATGVLIVGYTLVDGAAVRAGGESVRYTVAMFCGSAILLSIVTLLRRGPSRLRIEVRAYGWRNLGGGIAGALAYMLVLIAARSAPLGLVAAVRETSIIFGALGGWLILKEPFGKTRVRAAVLIAAGLMVLVV